MEFALLDVRSRAAWAQGDVKAEGALRIPPDDAARSARRLGLPHDRWLVLYCT
jgi:rhodanese-related sulfurtransferase